MAAIPIGETSLIDDANLVGYWPMDDDWNDDSPSGINLTPRNSVGFADGKFGRCGNFVAASSHYADASSIAELLINGAKTYTFWIKPYTIAGPNHTPIGVYNAGVRRSYVDIENVTSRITYVCQSLTSSNHSLVLDLDTWYFVACRLNSAISSDVFVNDDKDHFDLSGTEETGSEGVTFAIARPGSYDGQYFDGLIDDVAIFSRALTDQEISNIYTGEGWGPVPPTPSVNKLKYYRRMRFPGAITGL